MQNGFILFYYRSGSWGTRCLSLATVRPFAASGPCVWGHSRFSPAAFGPRAGHLSVQHFTLNQPKQGRQGLSFVAEGAAASRPSKWERIPGVSLWAIRSGNTLQFGKIPPLRQGSTDGSKQRLQGFCSTVRTFLPPTERSDRGNTTVGHRTRVLQPKRDGNLRPVLDLRRLNFSLYKGKFKMLTMKTIMSQIQEGDWFVTIDLKDAYFYIQVIQRHRRFLRFAFGGKAYKYKVAKSFPSAWPWRREHSRNAWMLHRPL